jgi:hypothetical protein
MSCQANRFIWWAYGGLRKRVSGEHPILTCWMFMHSSWKCSSGCYCATHKCSRGVDSTVSWPSLPGKPRGNWWSRFLHQICWGSLALLLAVPVQTNQCHLLGQVYEIGCGNWQLDSELHLLKGACLQRRLVQLEPLKQCFGDSCDKTYCLWWWCWATQETPSLILLWLGWQWKIVPYVLIGI